MEDFKTTFYIDKPQITATIKYFLKPEAKQAGKDELTYTSGHTDVVEVDDDGFIAFRNLGQCQITVATKLNSQDGTKIQEIIDVEVAVIIESLKAEVVSFEMDSRGDLYIYYKNISGEMFNFNYIEICCLDLNGKVIKTYLKWYSLRPLSVGYIVPITTFMEEIPEGTVKMVVKEITDSNKNIFK